jgi:hypothetical protein
MLHVARRSHPSSRSPMSLDHHDLAAITGGTSAPAPEEEAQASAEEPVEPAKAPAQGESSAAPPAAPPTQGGKRGNGCGGHGVSGKGWGGRRRRRR